MFRIELDEKDSKWFAYTRTIVHWAIVIAILAFVISSVIGLAIRWYTAILHPMQIYSNYHVIVGDIFSVLLMYELLALSRVISPSHLLDLVLTVIAREMILSVDQPHMLIYVVSFTMLFIVRLSWNRWSRPEHDTLLDT